MILIIRINNEFYLKIIFPRIRYINGEYHIGQDKSLYKGHESESIPIDLYDGNISENFNIIDKYNNINYSNSFISVNEDNYKIYEVILKPKVNGFYLEYTYNDINYINNIDTPNIFYYDY